MENNPYQTPAAAPAALSQTTYKPTINQILWGFEGRINRSTYWLWTVISALAFFLIFGFGIGFGELLATDDSTEMAEPSTLGIVIAIIAFIPYIWISWALAVKRWHDRDKSGFWVLINLIPYVGGIWSFIENGCLGGTQGMNTYGPPQA